MALQTRATVIPEPYVVPNTLEWDGNDGAWSTFTISIGTPPQDFRVLISTRGHETWVPVPEGCTSEDPNNCAASRGAQPFNSAASSGFETNESSTWELIGLYDLGLETNLNYSGNGQYGYDTIHLGSGQDQNSIEMDHQVVAGIADKDYYMGLLGLSTISSSFSSVGQPVASLFWNLKQQNKIPSLSYGYTAGAPYRFKKVPGSLVLGGYDQSRFEPLEFNFTFASDESRDLVVGVQSITATNTLRGLASMTSIGHLSFIDSTVPHLWLPGDICDRFEDAFGLTYDNTTDLYLVNDTIHQRLLNSNPQITFKLGNNIYTSDTNSTNIVLPYAAFDLQASSPYYENATNYFPIRRAANDSQYTIGRTLLQEAYLVVDKERRNFSIAQTIFSDPLPDSNIITIASSSSNSTATAAPKQSGLSTGATAGIAVAAVAVGIIVLTCLVVWWRRRRRRHTQVPDQALKKQTDEPYVDPWSRPVESDGNEVQEMAAAGSKPNEYKDPHAQELAGGPDDVAAYELAAAHVPMAYEMDANTSHPAAARTDGRFSWEE